MQSFHPPRPRPPQPCHPCPPQPCHPCAPQPAPPQNILIQKIIACERRSIPCLCTELHFPACEPTCLNSVCAAGTPCWRMTDGCTLCITLPLTAQLCDACGRCCTQPASIEVETDLPRSFACAMDDPRVSLLILPCVRLLRAECAGSGCFRAQLSVSLEIYLLRYETGHCGSLKPPCPQLPLYPQPMC